jgi:hypothetical protein
LTTPLLFQATGLTILPIPQRRVRLIPVPCRSSNPERRDDRDRKQIRELRRVRKHHGEGRWRKRKGIAKVVMFDGRQHVAEIHWYEAHGIGRKEVKIKRIIK